MRYQPVVLACLILIAGCASFGPAKHIDAQLREQVLKGDAVAIHTLISKGANPYTNDALESQAVAVAYRNGLNQLADQWVEQGRPAFQQAVSAVLAGDVDELRKSLEAPEFYYYTLNIESGTTIGYTAAGAYCHPCLKILSENNYDFTKGDFYQETALHAAASMDNVDAIAYLITTANMLEIRNSEGQTALLVAASQGRQNAVHALLVAGADPQATDNNGWSAINHVVSLAAPLADAATKQIIAMLSVAGTSIGLRSFDEKDPLFMAIRANNVAAVEALVSVGVPIDRPSNQGIRPLELAIQLGQLDVVRALVEAGVSLDQTLSDDRAPLIRAVISGDAPLVDMLLEAGAGIDAREEGMTLLHLLITSSSKDAEPEVLQRITELLLRRGADIRAVSPLGSSALHFAALNPRTLPVLESLLRHGASIEARDSGGNTPIFGAVVGGSIEAIELLVSVGADVNVRNDGGYSPLMTAAVNLSELSVEKSRRVVETLVLFGAELDMAGPSKMTALHIAAHEGRDGIAAALLQLGAYQWARDVNGHVPYMVARERGHQSTANLLSMQPKKEASPDFGMFGGFDSAE